MTTKTKSTAKSRKTGNKDEAVAQAVERLEAGVSRITDGEEFRRYLQTAARFPPLQRQ